MARFQLRVHPQVNNSPHGAMLLLLGVICVIHWMMFEMNYICCLNPLDLFESPCFNPQGLFKSPGWSAFCTASILYYLQVPYFPCSILRSIDAHVLTPCK